MYKYCQCATLMHTHARFMYKCMNSVNVVEKNVIKKDEEEQGEDLMEAVVVVMMTAEYMQLAQKGKVNTYCSVVYII